MDTRSTIRSRELTEQPTDGSLPFEPSREAGSAEASEMIEEHSSIQENVPLRRIDSQMDWESQRNSLFMEVRNMIEEERRAMSEDMRLEWSACLGELRRLMADPMQNPPVEKRQINTATSPGLNLKPLDMWHWPVHIPLWGGQHNSRFPHHTHCLTPSEVLNN
ncbi:hypothetical protein GE061_010967 [Apolygus lucorum]|uniref:Uncharacterized protein n=1 Tax=Apolygus lucorum TaxID=248454 RepID=A0A8S9XXI7_APOLU|nr:hypothetical protein GE061_010967 [Apolygus lucorum]